LPDTVCHPQLQIDWGKFAYALRPNLPSLKDFDKWIDIAVGAEENRGNRFSVSVANQQVNNNPRQQQTNYGQAGSSGYRQHQGISGRTTNNPGPTILTQSVAQETNKLPIPQCPACNESPGHRLDFCNTFKRMLVNQRAAFVADNNYCFKCLTRGHYGQDCRRPNMKCQTCEQTHHTLLHGADQQFPKKKGNISTDVFMIRTPQKNKLQPVLLTIVPVTVFKGTLSVDSYAILDPGSEATLATKSLAAKLRLSGKPIRIKFGNFNSSVEMQSEIVSFILKTSNDIVEATEVFIVPQINLSCRKINWPLLKRNWSHLIDLDLPPVDTLLVEILVGMDQVCSHMYLDIRKPDVGELGPIAVQTLFGWAVVGRIPAALVAGPRNKRNINTQSISEDVSLSALTEQFHLTESFGIDLTPPKIISFDDSQALKVLESSIKFISCGWQVDLPLRSPNLNLPNNRNQAISRYFGMERRLVRFQNTI
jgi:hypothetical protein